MIYTTVQRDGSTISSDDAWTSMEVPNEMILSGDYDRGDSWSKLRNAVREQIR